MFVIFFSAALYGMLLHFVSIFAGLTAAAMAEAMKLQKMKLMAMNSLHGSGSQNGTESENEELNSNAGKKHCAHELQGSPEHLSLCMGHKIKNLSQNLVLFFLCKLCSASVKSKLPHPFL